MLYFVPLAARDHLYALSPQTGQYIQHILIYPSWGTVWDAGRKKNVLFNDAVNTFYLRLYSVPIIQCPKGRKETLFYFKMVKDHSDNERKLTAISTWATVSD